MKVVDTQLLCWRDGSVMGKYLTGGWGSGYVVVENKSGIDKICGALKAHGGVDSFLIGHAIGLCCAFGFDTDCDGDTLENCPKSYVEAQLRILRKQVERVSYIDYGYGYMTRGGRLYKVWHICSGRCNLVEDIFGGMKWVFVHQYLPTSKFLDDAWALMCDDENMSVIMGAVREHVKQGGRS